MGKKAKEFKDLTTDELRNRTKELKKELMKENVQVAVGTVANPGKLKQIKKNIARLSTRLKQKEAGIK